MRLPIPVQDAQARAPGAPEEGGGKVLQRLALFEAQRGIVVARPLLDGAAADAAESSARSARDSAFAAEAVAERYIAAAQELDRAEPPAQEPDARAMPAAAPAPASAAVGAAPRWRPLGPSRIPDGQTYGSGRADVSGRVAAIAVDPADGAHLLCGAAAGGVWESRDGGASWAPRTDRMPTLTTGALAFDPSSPSTVYAGTGEGDFYAGLGAGLLRSRDGGRSWSVLVAAPFVGVGFHDLDVDPGNGDGLLAGTTRGLYKSVDGGASWVRRRSARTWKISRSGGGSPEILAACADGLQRSTSSGQTWTAVALPGAPAGWDRLSVDHAPADPRVAYAFGAAGGAAFLYRRDAAGDWQRIGTPSDLRTGQAWYDWFLAAAPDRTDQVYLGAINAHRGDLSGGAWSWLNLSAKSTGDSIHPDQHAIAFHPTDPDVVFVGNDGGVYRSPDRGVSWTSLNTNLAITEIEYVAHDPGSYRWLMGGTQDNGTNRFTGSTTWTHIADGDGGDCVVDSVDPDIVFHSFYNMGLRRSTDRGANWGGFVANGRNRPGYRSLFYPPMEGRGHSLAQAGQSVFLSRDSGASWSEVALPGDPIASAMTMPTPDALYLGTSDGRIFRIVWAGTSWSAATELTSPRAAYVSDLHVDAGDPDRVWATCSTIGGGRVFRSDDGGGSWTDRSAGLPDLPINAVQTPPGDPDRVWVAADLGVYQSRDGGASWSLFAAGLPNVLVGDLLYHPHTRMLRAGTRNRGVWEIPVDGDLAAPICGRQWTGRLGPHGAQRWFTFRWPATWHVLWTVMPTTVASGAPQLSWNVELERADAEYATYWITVRNHTDRTVDFEGRYCILGFH